mmetsp:Transcript_43293/g.75243  ORF Transcript_43293/g.75243 Transcript_43293/m.75243 type:complete len:204 (+) Transcript_43293:113-724(+)
MVVFVKVDRHLGRKATQKRKYPKGEPVIRRVRHATPGVPHRCINQPEYARKAINKHPTGVTLEKHGQGKDELEKRVQCEARGKIEQKKGFANRGILCSAGQGYLGTRGPSNNALVSFHICMFLDIHNILHQIANGHFNILVFLSRTALCIVVFTKQASVGRRDHCIVLKEVPSERTQVLKHRQPHVQICAHPVGKQDHFLSCS